MAFATSVNSGVAGRVAVTLAQPLYNPLRRAQQSQIGLSVDVAEVQWLADRQALMLRTAERYFDLALAEAALRVQQRQLVAVQRASEEAQDRFKLGATPVTDTYEAQACLGSVRVQRMAADIDLRLKRQGLADSSGLPVADLQARQPLNLPLFDGGSRDARQLEAMRLAEQAAAEVDSTREQVAQQVRSAWLQLSVGTERVAALAQALHAGGARSDATALDREVGDRTTLDLLNAQSDGAAAQLAQAQGRVALVMERLRLAALAGAAGKDGALDKQTKELIAMALSVSVSARCDPCLGFDADALVKLGCSHAEFEEMLGMCIYMGGGPALMVAAHPLQAFEQYGGGAALQA